MSDQTPPNPPQQPPTQPPAPGQPPVAGPPPVPGQQPNPYQPYPAYPPQGPGWQGTGWQGKPPSGKTATWALVLSIIPLGITWITAIVLAITALVGIRKGEQTGKGKAIAALVISGLWLVLVIALVAAGVAEDQKHDKARDEGTGEISVTTSRTGDCLASMPGSSKVTTVDIVPCSKPHVGEVFATFDLDVNDDASQDAIDRLAEGGCVKRFPAYVGIDYTRSKLAVAYLRPIAGSVAVDSGVSCIVSTGSTPTTGSLKNAKR